MIMTSVCPESLFHRSLSNDHDENDIIGLDVSSSFSDTVCVEYETV